MADTESTAQSVGLGLASLGRRVAVGSGALVALVSLLVDVPVWVASARGAGTAIAVLLVVRIASATLIGDGGAAETGTDA